MGWMNNVNAIFCFNDDTRENWEKENPILKEGEPSIVKDAVDWRWLKVGDGVTPWNELPYQEFPEGKAGIHYGTEMPTDDNHPIWINPLGAGIEIEHEFNEKSNNPVSSKAVAAAIKEMGRIYAEELISLVYPVGSIYISYNHINPATLFGGTWVRMQDRFLYGAKVSDTIGETGGESTHKLTISEMPSHDHKIYRTMNGASGTARYTPIAATGNVTTGTTDTGGGKAHNNMPPYIKVSMWRRTA